MMETRHALLYSDGSMGVYAEGWPMDDIEDERRTADRNETRPEHMTKIALVCFEVVEVLYEPTEPPPPTVSELERLKAENADLRRRLGLSPRAA